MRISDWSSDVCSSDLINIPAGVDEGTRIRLSGEGEAGARGAPSGDLYIFLHVKRHKIFEREGTTLFCRAPISFTTAALGGCRSEEHTSELQSLMRISYAVFCLKKKNHSQQPITKRKYYHHT